MAKQLNVNLAMTADTSKAKAELQSLQKTLDSLMIKTAGKDNFGISTELQRSVELAGQLKQQLANATMPNGNLDLSRFNLQLQKSNTNIKDYRVALSSLGPAGTQAFQQLASSIMSAEVPLRRSNALLTNFATTIKNTARWQISSSILHGFMGAIQGAYGYAKDLNESLNNIRIVTGQSVEQMSRFADQANRAARELSATTTAYTDAALIYYQQGLDDQAVKARTDVTIKLANVSRQSAEEVSSQMTAIWNNFDDGSHSLEYYADVITKLGASTASSSDEIAQGLQKFAAVADTVGLSYEKATAALATVVAETRQSADVVGTAFKTMFARFQGLSLGETLEDGVDLNKYSKALQTIGVNILDANGELKKMDDILDETYQRWSAISEAQRVALAETVAGTRQYAQFMAIMNNYDKIQANEQLAVGSSGTLQEQADIYAESWEAARKRVKASMQDIYNDLLDDKFFIKLLNGFSKAIDVVDNFIEGIGGLPSVLLMLGGIVTQVFGKQITAAIHTAIDNIHMMSAAGRASALELRKNTIQEVVNAASTPSRAHQNEGQGASAAVQGQATAQQALLDNESRLTEMEKQRAQDMIKITESLGQQAIAAGKVADEDKRAADEVARQVQKSAAARAASKEKDSAKQEQARLTMLEEIKAKQKDLRESYKLSAKAVSDFDKTFDGISTKDTPLDDIKAKAAQLKTSLGDLPDEAEKAFQAFEKTSKDATPEEIQAALDKIRDSLQDLPEEKIKELKTALLGGQQQVSKKEMAQVDDEVRRTAEAFEKEANSAQSSVEANEAVGESGERVAEKIRGMRGATGDAAAGFTQLSSVLMSVTTAIRAFKNIGNIWNDKDLSTGEKILQTLSATAMIMPALTALTQKDLAINLKALAVKTKDALVRGGLIILGKGQTVVNEELAVTGWAALGPALLFVAIAAAVIAALVAIGYAVKNGIDAFEADAIAAEKASKAAEELGKASEEAKNKVTELKSAFDDYNSIVDKLNDCVRGTDEWNAALQEVNDSVRELLTNYPELAGKLENLGNGVLGFSQETLDSVLEEYTQKATTANNMALMANYSAANANTKALATDIFRSNVVYDTAYGDTAVDSYAAKKQQIINDVRENASEYIGDNIETFRKKIGGQLNLSDKQFKEFFDSIHELAVESQKVADSLEASANIIANDELYDEYKNMGQRAADTITEIGSEAYETAYKEIYEAVIKKSNAYSQSNKQSDLETNENSIWNRYLKAIGHDKDTNYKLDKNAIRGNDQNRTYAFTIGDEEQEISAEQMAAAIAASEALTEMGAAASEAAELIGQFGVAGQGFAAGMAGSKNSDNSFSTANYFQNFTAGEIAQLKAGIIEGENGEYSLSEDFLNAIGMTEEQFTKLSEMMGFTVDDLVNGLDNVASTITQEQKDVLSSLGVDLSKMTVGKQQNLYKNYEAAAENANQYGISVGAIGVQNAGASGLSDFYNEIAKIDFHSENAADAVHRGQGPER